ncbi:MAG TPA: prolyl oligopeptidase family serine peptidase [Longimicrobiales bacterium]
MNVTHRPLMRAAALGVLLAWPAAAAAQGTPEDYRRAATLRERLAGLTIGVAEAPHWIEGSHRFWYRKSVRGGHEFVLVDAATLERRPPFDHGRLAAALSAETGEAYTATTLPFETFRYAGGEEAIEVEAAGSVWRCGLVEYRCARVGDAAERRNRGRGRREEAREVTSVVSPDGRLEAFIYNNNVAVRARGSEEFTVLSWDGTEGDAYQVGSIRWSPDSRRLVAYRRRPGYRRMVHYVLSSPADRVQPRDTAIFYRKPGDVLDVHRPVLFDVEKRTAIEIDNALFPDPYQISEAVWRKDGRAFTFEYNERGHQVYRIIEVDAETGRARAVVSEEVPTFFSYRPATGRQTDSGKKFRFDIDDGREVIWMSERDGWNHLYLYDGETGRVKNQITRGEWVVRAVDSVDVENRQIWFRASGMNPGQDPYFVHYYRIDFDGSDLVAYTEANGNHRVYWSPDREYYVDMYSRVDLPTVMELRRTRDRRLLATLERGDMSAQLATGWRPPEVFVARGRDGKTDIWGIIVRPVNFDPSRKYPVIEQVYAGPQGSFVPKDWNPFPSTQALAELGFIVVQIDGMGTNNRSKAFHDVAWKNLGDAGFPDRILWHKAVAARYPYYDISRVGIYGGSAGGQNALGALLFHGDFYDAAIATNGCHDNRMDKIWWNEHWMGKLGPHYEASSNVVNAHRLTGKLMLIVGEFDTNVDPSSTMQVVNALIAAGKRFDLVVQPGGGHGLYGQYYTNLRYDFFVEHLLGVEPPDRNAPDAADRVSWIPAEPGPEPDFFSAPDAAPPYTWW